MTGAGGSADGNDEEVSPFPAAYGSVGGSQPEAGSGPTPPSAGDPRNPSRGGSRDGGSRDGSEGRPPRRRPTLPPSTDPRPSRRDPRGASRSDARSESRYEDRPDARYEDRPDAGSGARPDSRAAAESADRSRSRPSRDRRLSRPDPAGISTGPVQVVAAGVGPTVPVSRAVAPSPTDAGGGAPARPTGRSSRSASGGLPAGTGSRGSSGGSHARTSTDRTAMAEPATMAIPAATPSSAPSTSSNGALRAAPGTAVSDAVAMQVAREYAPDAEIRLGGHHWWQHRRKVTVVRSRSARRLVRRLDTWTVFKVSLIFYLLLLVIVLVAGIVAWRVAGQVGFITDIQKGVRSLADDQSFKLHGGVVFKYSLMGGAALAVAGTILNVVAAMLYNLISDIVGGIQVIVVTEPD